MKRCTTCQEEKPFSEFTKNAKMKDGLSIYCKFCLRLSRRRQYQKNKESVIERNRSRAALTREVNREWIVNYLSENPCVDCGEEDPIVLEFDHVRGQKVAGVGYMVSNAWSLDRIKEEVSKCDVRCANCHRRKTSHQLGWYRSI